MDGDIYEKLGEFSPVWWARGPHVQTILGHALNRVPPPSGERALEVELPDGDRLVLLENLPPLGSPRGAVLLMHGLGGDAAARYMVSAARRFCESGWATYRLNHRGAGAGAGLSERMYNSGLSDDVERVLEVLGARNPDLPLAAVGYSMSGNILLKYLGERGAATAPGLAGAVAVNPPVELGLAVEHTALKRNLVYQHRFVRLLKGQVAANTGAAGTGSQPWSRVKSIREFDEVVTVPRWGYKDPDDYYRCASAEHHLGGIRLPTLVLMSDDDPFHPAKRLASADWPAAVALKITRGGGHMGYLSARPTSWNDRRWLDQAVVRATMHFAGQ